MGRYTYNSATPYYIHNSIMSKRKGTSFLNDVEENPTYKTILEQHCKDIKLEKRISNQYLSLYQNFLKDNNVRIDFTQLDMEKINQQISTEMEKLLNGASKKAQQQYIDLFDEKTLYQRIMEKAEEYMDTGNGQALYEINNKIMEPLFDNIAKSFGSNSYGDFIEILKNTSSFQDSGFSDKFLKQIQKTSEQYDIAIEKLKALKSNNGIDSKSIQKSLRRIVSGLSTSLSQNLLSTVIGEYSGFLATDSIKKEIETTLLGYKHEGTTQAVSLSGEKVTKKQDNAISTIIDIDGKKINIIIGLSNKWYFSQKETKAEIGKNTIQNDLSISSGRMGSVIRLLEQVEDIKMKYLIANVVHFKTTNAKNKKEGLIELENRYQIPTLVYRNIILLGFLSGFVSAGKRDFVNYFLINGQFKSVLEIIQDFLETKTKIEDYFSVFFGSKLYKTPVSVISVNENFWGENPLKGSKERLVRLDRVPILLEMHIGKIIRAQNNLEG